MLEVSKQSQNKSDGDIISILNNMLKTGKFQTSPYNKYTFEFGMNIMGTKDGPRPMIFINPILDGTNNEYRILVPMPLTADTPLFPILFTIIHHMVTRIDSPKKHTMTKKGLDETYDTIYTNLDDIIRIITISTPNVSMQRSIIEKDIKATYIRFCLGQDKTLNAAFDTIRSVQIEEENDTSNIILK